MESLWNPSLWLFQSLFPFSYMYEKVLPPFLSLPSVTHRRSDLETDIPVGSESKFRGFFQPQFSYPYSGSVRPMVVMGPGPWLFKNL